tara:strand:- start:1534 stop:1761 length:228 start_codon:yes stop_codon:yes gene_type:complete
MTVSSDGSGSYVDAYVPCVSSLNLVADPSGSGVKIPDCSVQPKRKIASNIKIDFLIMSFFLECIIVNNKITYAKN